MKEAQQIFLKRTKAILIYIGVIKPEVTLHEKSWLAYHDNGFTPLQAVKEDMEGFMEIPHIQWSKVYEITLSL